MAYRTCYIKNIEGVANTLFGKSFAIDEVFQIQDVVRPAWMGSSAVDDAISAGTHEILDNAQASLADKVAQRNWLNDYDTTPTDNSSRPLYRLAMTEKGWKFLSHMVKVTTGKEYDSAESIETIAIRQITFKGENRAPFSVKHFKDVSGAQTLVTDYTADQANINETRITLRPSYDYDILKGTIFNNAAATGRCEVGVGIGNFDDTDDDIGQLEVAPSVFVDAYSEFIGGLDLKKFVGVMHVDGESSKMINKDIGYGMDMNQIQIRIYHEAGLQHHFACSLEYYRE